MNPAPTKKKSFLDLFPVPEFLLLSTSGLAVTDSYVRFLKLRRGRLSGEFDLAHSAAAKLPEGVVTSGFINEKETLIKNLKEFATKNGIRYVRATLPEEKAYLFTTIIDKVPLDGVRDAIAFIVEENAPVKLAESVFDFEIIDDVENSSEIKVAVSVLPHRVTSTYIEVLLAAGVTPVAFDIESQAIARAVIPRGDVRPHLIINLGAHKTGFYVVANEVVQFSSTHPYGSGGEVPANDDELKTELTKLLAFWNSRTDKHGVPEKKIEKIYLCGTEAEKEEFIKNLLQGFGIEYAQANVWINAFSFRDRVPEIPLGDSFAYAAAIGLALPPRPKMYV